VPPGHPARLNKESLKTVHRSKPFQPPTGAEAAQKQAEQQANTYARRDSGVSDEVWEQLRRDRRAEQEREAEYQELLKAKQKASEEEREKIVKWLLEERRRKAEAEMRKKLEMMGVCPVGYPMDQAG
jgi:hypothetical protein